MKCSRCGKIYEGSRSLFTVEIRLNDIVLDELYLCPECMDKVNECIEGEDTDEH